MGEQTTAIRHPIFARMCVRLSRRAEARGAVEYRRELLSGLSGKVIEVGAGHGLNFPYYPPSVKEVVAVEPEPYLRTRAIQAAREVSIAITLVDGVAEQLPAVTASFDAGVASLVLCSVRDADRALAELFRVIRPGGELRFYEHVRAATPGLARLQRAADTLFWPCVGGGCHVSRDTGAALEKAGFVIERCHNFSFRPSPLLFLVSPHVLGIARRP